MHTTGKPYRKHAGIHGDFDAIVVGSGMGGMTAGTLLAKNGKAVLLLEQNAVVGGLTQSYTRRGYAWNTGLHYIGDVAKEHSTTRKVFDYLTAGRITWAPLPSIYNRMAIGSRIYDIPAGRAPLREALTGWFPQEAAAIDRYLDMVGAAAKASGPFFAQKALPERMITDDMAQLSAPFHALSDRITGDVLRALTDNEELIAVLCANWGDYSSPPHRSSFAMHCMLQQHYLDGGSYPSGGARVLADAMMPVIEANGGQVFHGASVEQILVDDDLVATGVRLEGGETVSAPIVISNAGVQNTFGHLVDAGVSDRAGLSEKLGQVDDTYALVGLNIGLSRDAAALGITPANIWAHPGPDFERNLADHAADFDAPFPWTFITFPSARDPEWAEARPGTSTIEMYAYTNFEHFAQWDGTKWHKRGDAYLARKATIEARLLVELDRFVPKARAALDVIEVSTPLTYQTFVRRARGGFMGVESTPDRFRAQWLRATTPVRGLYLTGQDVTTDGVIGAAMGGVLSASSVLGRNLMTDIKSG